MKKFLIVLVMMCVSAGCSVLTPAKTQELLTHTQEWSDKLDTLQEVSTSNAEALNTIGVVNDEMLEKVAQVNEEIDRVQPQILAVTDAITNMPLTGDVGQDIIAAVGAANAASAPYNPWAVPIGGVITLVSIIFGAIMKKKAKDETERANRVALMASEEAENRYKAEAAAAKSDAKNRAYKVAVNRTMKEVSKSSNDDTKSVELLLYDNIGLARKNGV